MKTPSTHPSISLLVDDLLQQLAAAPVEMPLIGKVNLVDGLKRLGRSGKLVRIVHFNLNLPVQSHYDHVRSVARLADICAEKLSLDTHARTEIAHLIAFHDLTDRQRTACCIAFHDLAEVIVGDVPEFTSEDLTEGVIDFLSPFSVEETNKSIEASLPQPLRTSFHQTLDLLSTGEGKVFHFFKMIDRMEPITAVWRYIHTYHSTIEIHHFLVAMADFFGNPKPRTYCIDETTRSTVDAFQTPANALNFYTQKTVRSNSPSLQQAIIEEFIKETPIEPIVFS